MNMKFKKLTLVLVVVMMASTLAPAFAKNPFADVPADHWAYDSIVELAAAGLIEGYPDGTFGGSRMMTRYEAAMVFARALARLEGQIADTDVLAELDQIKAELTDEIKAQMAAMDKPVVETKVIEKVGGEVDEATLARIRAAEIAAESAEGDIAYVEARVLGLIDGIRYDVNKLQEQVNEPAVEQPSMEEIEALIAAKVQEGILEAALSAKEVVKETTVVEKVVATTPELTEEDVELIAESIIARQLQQYELLIVRALRENAEQNQRLDALEAAQADFASKEEVEAVAASVKELEKVKFGGTLKFEAKNSYNEIIDPITKKGTDEFEYRYGFSQSADLTLNIKASDTVNVKAIANGTISAGATAPFNMSAYGVDVTSEGLAKRLIVGRNVVTGPMTNSRFGPYVMAEKAATAKYLFAGLADLDIADGLTGNIFLTSPEAKSAENGSNTFEDVTAAFGLKYELSPAFGIKGAVVAHKPVAEIGPNADSVGGGIFGTIAKFDYEGNVVMDLAKEDDNLLFGGSLGTKFGPLSLSGEYYQAQANYGEGVVGVPFEFDAGRKLMELGAGVEFLGIELDGTFYQEWDGEEDATKLASAYKLDASKGFDFVVPFTVSATYAANTDKDETKVQHALAKLAVGPAEEPDLGFFYNASLTYVKNEFVKDGTWKVADDYTVQDAAIVDGKVKYIMDYRGATVDLGYGANFRMPTEPEGDKVLTHKVDLGYGFTKDVKLTLGSNIKQTFADAETENIVTYNAGLTVKF